MSSINNCFPLFCPSVQFIIEFARNVFDYSVPSYQCQIITTVQVWHSDSPQKIRAMDEMAVTQLSFFEQRKKIRVNSIHNIDS